MREGLIYDIMVDVDERPEGWNKELYEKLSFEYLIECSHNLRIIEWNQLYDAYLKSEWERIFLNEVYDSRNIAKLIDDDSDFIQPDFSGINFNNTNFDDANLSRTRLDGPNFRNVHLDGANLSRTRLDGANFTEARLDGAHFNESHMEGVSFRYARIRSASFIRAYLQGSDLSMTNLEGANFLMANLVGAVIRYAKINEDTQFIKNTRDNKTDFTGTSLSFTQIDQELKTTLERNTRVFRWEEWYKEPKFYPFIGKMIYSLWITCCRNWHLIKDPPGRRYDSKDCPPLETSNFYLTLKKIWYFPTKPPAPIKSPFDQSCDEREYERIRIHWEDMHSWIDGIINAFVKLFWWVSDYGSSTKRILAVFFGWNLFWAFVYFYVLPLFPCTTTIVLNVSNIGAAILQTNLMMFSITDTATEVLDLFSMFCVTIHIVIGYFILAALITRIGIMFET